MSMPINLDRVTCNELWTDEEQIWEKTKPMHAGNLSPFLKVMLAQGQCRTLSPLKVGSFGASSIRTLALFAAMVLLVLGGILGWTLWHERALPMAQPIETANHYIATAPALAETVSTGPAGTQEARQTEPNAEKPEPDSKERIVTISGVVTTWEGQPTAEATVTLDNLEAVSRSLEHAMVSLDAESVTPIELSTKTDTNGRFEFNPAGVAFSITNYPLRLCAETDALCGETSIYIMPSPSQDFVEVVVGPCLGINGIVTDSAGIPIERAQLRLKESREAGAGFSEQGFGPFSTGPDGGFAVKHLTGGQFKFLVYANGYTNLTTDWIAAGTDGIIFTLERGNSISGRVIESRSQEPVPNGYVTAVFETGTRISVTRTDADGQFVLTGLTPGKAEVQLQSGGIPPTPYIMPLPMGLDIVEGRPVTGLELKVLLGAVISGTVMDATSGIPLSEGILTVTGPSVPRNDQPEQMPIRAEFKVDAQGHYEALGLPPGKLDMHIKCKGYEENDVQVTVQRYGIRQRLNLELRAMSAVGGTVVDASGTPVSGANVIAVYDTHNASSWPNPVASDSQGRFTVHLPKKTAVRLQASHGVGISPISTPVKPGTNGVVLRLSDTGNIEGTVVDTAGNPVGGVRVEIEPVDGQKQGVIRFAVSPYTLLPEYTPGFKCNTGINGFFQSGAVLAGYYDITVYAKGSDSPAGGAEVFVRGGQTLQTRLQIELANYGAIAGRVTANRIPQSGISISVENMPAVTGDDGRYRIYPVTPGAVTIRLSIDGQTQERTVEARAEQTVMVDFDLAVDGTRGSVEGVVSLNGSPLSKAAVTLTPTATHGPSDNFSADTNDQGEFRFDGVAAGDYFCEVLAVSRAMSRPEFVLGDESNITVQEGGTAYVQFDLTGASIEIMVIGLRKDEYARVWLLTGDSEASEISPNALGMLAQNTIAASPVDSDGIAHFHGLVPGSYVVVTVALPRDRQNTDANLLQSALAERYAAVRLDAIQDEVQQVTLPLPLN